MAAGGENRGWLPVPARGLFELEGEVLVLVLEREDLIGARGTQERKGSGPVEDPVRGRRRVSKLLLEEHDDDGLRRRHRCFDAAGDRDRHLIADEVLLQRKEVAVQAGQRARREEEWERDNERAKAGAQRGTLCLSR